MRVTRNGQITIPKHIRKKLGITEGTEVDVRLQKDTILVKKKLYDWNKHEPVFTDEVMEKMRELREKQHSKYSEQLHERFS